MSLSDLAALGSFISGLAVLVSLVFLYFQLKQIGLQVKQTEKNQQASIRQNRATRTVEIIMASASEGALAEALLRCSGGSSDIADTQFALFSNYCKASFYHYEDSFHQHREGLLNDSAFDGATVNFRELLANVGWRASWVFHRRSFESEFIGWMDQLVAETPIRPPFDAFAQWKAEVCGMNEPTATS